MKYKLIACLIVCLGMFYGGGKPILPVAMAQEQPSDPVISLTVKDEPLIDALDTIAGQTGYRFDLTPQWQDHPVSATIADLPLEQGLKRLLRSLNHTILWDDNRTVIIKVYGRIIPGSSRGISFAPPPRPEPEIPPGIPEDEPFDEDDEADEQQETLPDTDLETDLDTDGQSDETGRLPADSADRE